MTRTIAPNPLPHRGGRRFLPVVAAFVWAVALHVAVAAGLAGVGGEVRSVSSAPEGFRMVQVSGQAEPAGQPAAPPRAEARSARKPATEPAEEAAPAPEPAAQDAPPGAEPELVAARRPLKRAVAPEPEPAPAKPDPAPSSNAEGEPAAGPAPEAEPAPKPEKTAKAAGDAGEFRPPGLPAGYRSNPPPAYPPRARRRQLEGKVLLQVRVDADGRAQRVTVAASSGHVLLDRAARKAVKGWTFRPAERDGRTVAGSVKVPVHFRLSRR